MGDTPEPDNPPLGSGRLSSSAWRNSLLRSLNSIHTLGDFSWAEMFDVWVNPGLEVDGVGQIPLPLCPRDALTVRDMCTPAPVNIGGEAVVDRSVRNAWELEPHQFGLANPNWESFLADTVVPAASRQLGLVGAWVSLHKLLLYEPGSFFVPHRDSQNGPGTVGSLVVCLPSAHDGGEVHVSYNGEERNYRTAEASRFDLSALAWFGDVVHEIKPLLWGYRLVLMYNIVLPLGSSPRSASFFDNQIESLQRVLTSWRETDHRDYRVVYLLRHQYTEAAMCMDNLIGRDAAVCQLLHRTASAAGFCVFLATMTRRVKKDNDEDDYHDDDDDDYGVGVGGADGEERTILRKMYTCKGDLVARSLDRLGDIPCPQLPSSAGNEFAEDLDHEDQPALRLRHAAVVIWAKSKLRSLLRLDSGNLRVDALIPELAQDFRGGQDEESRDCITRFIKKCCRGGLHRPKSTAPQIIDWAIVHDDQSLYDAALKVSWYLPDVQTVIARAVAKEYSDNAEADNLVVGILEKRLGDVVKDFGGLSVLEDVLESFTSSLGDGHLEDLYRIWKNETLTARLEAMTRISVGQQNFVAELMLARHEETGYTEWVTTSFLPLLCTRGTPSFLRGFLECVFGKYGFTLEEKGAIYTQVLGTAECTYLMPRADLENCLSWRGDADAFVSLIDQCLSLDIADCLSHMLAENGREFSDSRLPSRAEPVVVAFAVKLVRMLQRRGGVETPAMSAVKAFIETLLRALLNTAPVYPVERFQGWAGPRRGCGSCNDCRELDSFLGDETSTWTRFQKPLAQRRHLETRLSRDGLLEWETTREKTRPSDVIKSLRVRKLKTVLERDLDVFWSEMVVFKAIVAPLRGESLEKLLDDKAYRELILLEGIVPETEPGARKRSAWGDEDEEGQEQKRRR